VINCFGSKYFTFKNIILLLWYSKFFLNYQRVKKISVTKNVNFSNEWKKKLKYHLLTRKDWRGITIKSNLFKDVLYSKLCNFTILKKIIKILIAEKKITLLDIGSYTNMFLPLFKGFKNIYLSDLSPLAQKKGFKFFLLNGKDFRNIPDQSIDIIFSIETLIRIDKEILAVYLIEFNRILKPGGIILCHVPNMFHYVSYYKLFTFVSKKFYHKLLNKNFYFKLNNKIIYNSSFLIAQKKNNTIEKNNSKKRKLSYSIYSKIFTL
jgi:ubiquinone/menaquinone biosynthesis C-methylase UbiE